MIFMKSMISGSVPDVTVQNRARDFEAGPLKSCAPTISCIFQRFLTGEVFRRNLVTVRSCTVESIIVAAYQAFAASRTAVGAHESSIRSVFQRSILGVTGGASYSV